MMWVAKILAMFVVLVMLSYMVRHFIFAMSRLFRHQRMNYTDLSGFHLPSITVLIPMHNEEAVAPDVIEALLEADYPHDPELFEIIPINDHSDDRTGDILDEYAKKYPFIKAELWRGSSEECGTVWSCDRRSSSWRFPRSI